MSREELINKIKEAEAFLKKNNRNYFVSISSYMQNGIDIEIYWGDWKHDHLACDYLMNQLGLEKANEITTEVDGSDVYSSVHVYKAY